MKLKLKGRRFDTIEEIQVELQKCLTLWQRRTYRKRSKNGGDGGAGVCLREGATSRVMAADRPYGEFYDFYSVNSEYFGYTLVFTKWPTNASNFLFICFCSCTFWHIYTISREPVFTF
jgi:hypothetical protein